MELFSNTFSGDSNGFVVSIYSVKVIALLLLGIVTYPTHKIKQLSRHNRMNLYGQILFLSVNSGHGPLSNRLAAKWSSSLGTKAFFSSAIL